MRLDWLVNIRAYHNIKTRALVKAVIAMKEAIKEIFIKNGAEVCGVANIDLFADCPEGFSPLDIYPGCKSVIVFAVPVPKGTAFVNPRIVYQHFNYIGPAELDRIAFNSANEIERDYKSAVVVPVPADGPYEYWNAEKMEGRGCC